MTIIIDDPANDELIQANSIGTRFTRQTLTVFDIEEIVRKRIERTLSPEPLGVITIKLPINHYSTKSIEEQREANRRLFDGKQ